jgi:hypothetical protein
MTFVNIAPGQAGVQDDLLNSTTLRARVGVKEI